MKSITFKKGYDYVISELEKNRFVYKNNALEKIGDFEKNYNVRFPEDFRIFLVELEVIVSYLESKLYDGKGSIYEYIEYIDFPSGYTFFDEKGKGVIKVGDIYSINPKSVLNVFNFFINEGKIRYFPIFNNGCGDYIVIDLDEKSEKAIYRWNHEFPEGDSNKIKFLSKSFSDFMDSLSKKKKGILERFFKK